MLGESVSCTNTWYVFCGKVITEAHIHSVTGREVRVRVGTYQALASGASQYLVSRSDNIRPESSCGGFLTLGCTRHLSLYADYVALQEVAVVITKYLLSVVTFA